VRRVLHLLCGSHIDFQCHQMYTLIFFLLLFLFFSQKVNIFFVSSGCLIVLLLWMPKCLTKI